MTPEPDPPTGPHITILARTIRETHLDRLVSAPWRGVWCRPLRLIGYDSARDVTGRVLSQTLRLEGGLQITTHNPNLKIRIHLQ